jgi:hypothetical protein
MRVKRGDGDRREELWGGGIMRWLHIGGVERKQTLAVELGGRRYNWRRTRGGDFVRILGWAVEI